VTATCSEGKDRTAVRTAVAIAAATGLAGLSLAAAYLRVDELHTAFNFAFLGCPWDAAALRATIDQRLAVHAPVGAAAPGYCPITKFPGT